MKKNILYIFLFHTTLQTIKTDHEQYLSPEGAEEQYIETLQNHADDESIYSFGLLGQEHGDLVQQTKIDLQKFPNLLILSNLINKLLNKKYNDFTIEKSEEEEGFDSALTEKKRVYTLSRKVYSRIFRYITEIRDEVEFFYDKLDYLEITTEDLLEFFDFGDYYENVIKDINKENPGFFKFKRELDLIVFEFSTSMRDFGQAIRNFYQINIFISGFFEPYRKEFLEDDPDNVILKVDKGVKMVNQILEAKSYLDMLINNVLKGVSQVRSIRNDILYAISKFKEIEDFEFNLGKKRILESSSGFWMQFCFVIFIGFF